MYRLLVDDIPTGTSATKGVMISSLIELEKDEKPQTIYSIYRETDAKYVLFVTKNGIVKKTTLDEYVKTKKKSGIQAITIKEGDSLAFVSLIKDEQLMLVTKKGQVLRFESNEISASGRMTMGVKGINLADGDEVVSALAVRDTTDSLAIFTEYGLGKKVSLDEFPLQKRAGKGLLCYKASSTSGDISCATLVADNDSVLVAGAPNSICISGSDISALGRTATGCAVIKGSKVLSVSKV